MEGQEVGPGHMTPPVWAVCEDNSQEKDSKSLQVLNLEGILLGTAWSE